MKKIILSLIAIMATMSINAQVVKVYNNGELTATYTNTATNHYKVVFEMAATGEGTVSESAGISGNKVQSVQLWENGPKWAVFNVGAKSASEYGDYYCWGSTNATDYCKNTTDIQGTSYDTAKNIWGGNWQMPKETDFSNLLSTTYTDGGVWKSADESGYGIAGLLVTGKGDYASKSVFFPASGFYKPSEGLICQGTDGNYWASSPYSYSNASQLYFRDVDKFITNDVHYHGLFVRPVLKSSDVYMPVIKVYENGTLTATYVNTADNTYKVVFEEEAPSHEYVDLGLPSGTKWATCNIGAENPEDAGLYFAWGETTGHSGAADESTRVCYDGYSYDWPTAPFNIGKEDYNLDYFENTGRTESTGSADGTELIAKYDAATVHWGSEWCMPTEAQLAELETECNWTYDKDKKGFKVSNKSDATKFIFLPSAGSRYGVYIHNDGSTCYWTRSLNPWSPQTAYCMQTGNSYPPYFEVSDGRYHGYTIRAVRSK